LHYARRVQLEFRPQAATSAQADLALGVHTDVVAEMLKNYMDVFHRGDNEVGSCIMQHYNSQHLRCICRPVRYLFRPVLSRQSLNQGRARVPLKRATTHIAVPSNR
jgi:hypothetical protein